MSSMNIFWEVPVLSSYEMNTATRVQILDDADCVLQNTNTIGKDMNLIILTPAMGKTIGQTEIFSLG